MCCSGSAAQGGVQIAEDIVDMLRPNGEADGVGPDAASSSSVIWEWVVLAGWMARDFTSATLASREKS